MERQGLYIVLLGAPGAGKGTQAAALARHLGIAHISSGDLFRENLQQGTELGVLAKSYMDKGELVPDQVTISMVMERLSRADCGGPSGRGAILDGFPRTLTQARALDVALAAANVADADPAGGRAAGGRIALVPLIQVDDEEVIRRLSGRRVCRECGAVYHLVFNPPKVEGVCDQCALGRGGGQLYQREDDLPETVRRRLYTYYKETGPLIGYYFAQDLLVEIDGQQAIDQVQAELVAATRRVSKPHEACGRGVVDTGEAIGA